MCHVSSFTCDAVAIFQGFVFPSSYLRCIVVYLPARRFRPSCVFTSALQRSVWLTKAKTESTEDRISKSVA